MNDLLLRGVALLLFLVVLGGAVYGAEQAFGDPAAHGGPAGAVSVSSPEGTKLALAGSSVTFPLVVRNNGAETLDLTLRTAGASLPVRFVPATLHLAPGASAGAYATVDVRAQQAPGLQRLAVQAADSHNATLGSTSLALSVAQPAQPAREGDAVQVDYVGRFANGTLFDTSVRAIGEGPFPKPDGFRRDYQPIQVTLNDQAGTIQGFWRGLLGLGEGMSKTMVLPPELAYGNATIRQEVPRTQDLPRLSQAYERVQHFPRAVLSQYLNDSSQVGDLLRIPDPSGNNRTYRITALEGGNATLVWQVQVGDPFTIYPIWPGQSRAFNVTNTTVVFRTTPDDPDQGLTFYAFWPNASKVKSMNETTLVLETSPPVGQPFQVPQRTGVLQATVVALTPTTIVIERANDHPLGGQTLLFDVTVRGVQRVFQAP